jgi:hypothetical protein
MLVIPDDMLIGEAWLLISEKIRVATTGFHSPDRTVYDDRTLSCDRIH